MRMCRRGRGFALFVLFLLNFMGRYWKVGYSEMLSAQ
jgi:hypothetical protein